MASPNKQPSDEPEWAITPAKGDVVICRFVGRLSATGGRHSAELLALELRKGSRHVVFDVEFMTGYDTAARNAWQATLMPHRKNIASITMRGGNALVKLGATVLAMALGCPLRSI